MVGRPSNRDERYEQVMQALVGCVARYGLEGATLTQIAQAAGLSRPLIRHHLGNRGEMLSTLQTYVLNTFDASYEHYIENEDKVYSNDDLIDFLFNEKSSSSPDMVLAFAALTARAAEDAVLQEACRKSLLNFEKKMAQAISTANPTASKQATNIVAHGLTAIYFNHTSLVSLNMPEVWLSTAKGVAHELLKTLENRQ